jgi:hypothetical protein
MSVTSVVKTEGKQYRMKVQHLNREAGYQGRPRQPQSSMYHLGITPHSGFRWSTKILWAGTSGNDLLTVFK